MSFRARVRLFPVAAALLSIRLGAQSQLAGTAGGGLHMMNTDLAVLEAQEVRKDLACTVTPSKPVLGFDLRFHAGYEVAVPLKELAGDGNQLTMVFRVIPEGHDDDPVYFAQHVSVPALDDVDRG